MKRTIRRGVFETNSSSVHSITMCSEAEYDKWQNNDELYFWEYTQKFYTKEELIKELKLRGYYSDNDFSSSQNIRNIMYAESAFTFMEYFARDMETYESTYKTPSGESIVAFGYYGSN